MAATTPRSPGSATRWQLSGKRPTASAPLKLGFSLPLISRSMGVIYGCGLSATSGMVTSAMSGGPGVEAHTTLSAARCRARVHQSPAYRLHVLAADKGAVTSSLGVAIAAASLDDA